MRVSNYRRAPKVYILLNISGKCGFQNAAGPQNYDYAHLPVEYGLCRTKMFAVSLLLETISVLCIRRRITGCGSSSFVSGALVDYLRFLFSFRDFIFVLSFSPLVWRYIFGCSLSSVFHQMIACPLGFLHCFIANYSARFATRAGLHERLQE